MIVEQIGPDGKPVYYNEINGKRIFISNQKAARAQYIRQRNINAHRPNDQKVHYAYAEPAKEFVDETYYNPHKQRFETKIAKQQYAIDPETGKTDYNNPLGAKVKTRSTSTEAVGSRGRNIKEGIKKTTGKVLKGVTDAATGITDTMRVAEEGLKAQEKANRAQAQAQANANEANLAAADMNIARSEERANARNPYGNADRRTAAGAAQAAAATAAGDAVRGASLAANEAATQAANTQGASNLSAEINRSDSLRQRANEYGIQGHEMNIAANETRAEGENTAAKALEDGKFNAEARALTMAGDTGTDQNDTYKQTQESRQYETQKETEPESNTGSIYDPIIMALESGNMTEAGRLYGSDDRTKANELRQALIDGGKKFNITPAQFNQFKAAAQAQMGNTPTVIKLDDLNVSDLNCKDVVRPKFLDGIFKAYKGRT